MRRAAAFATATIATAALAATIAVAPIAGAAPAQVPPAVDCALPGPLADPACALIEQIEGITAPADGAVTDQLAPLAPVLDPVVPAPSGEGSAPAPAPAAQPSAQATSPGSPTAADLGAEPAASYNASLSRSSSPAVPDLPLGSTLELSPLALPSFGLGGTPAVSAAELAATDGVVDDVVLPAARAAAELPDGSKATAVVIALSMVLLAAGLLLDQHRKARQPFQL